MTTNILNYCNGVVALSQPPHAGKNRDAVLCVMYFFCAYVHIWKPPLKIPAYATETALILYSMQHTHTTTAQCSLILTSATRELKFGSEQGSGVGGKRLYCSTVYDSDTVSTLACGIAGVSTVHLLYGTSVLEVPVGKCFPCSLPPNLDFRPGVSRKRLTVLQA